MFGLGVLELLIIGLICVLPLSLLVIVIVLVSAVSSRSLDESGPRPGMAPCPKCGALVDVGIKSCPDCGLVLP